MVYRLAGVWALAMLAVFIQAIRLSYRIEARSPDLTQPQRLSAQGDDVPHVITNMERRARRGNAGACGGA